MNLHAFAENLTKEFHQHLKVVMNERGGLTFTLGVKSIDIDAEGNVHNVAQALPEPEEAVRTPRHEPAPTPEPKAEAPKHRPLPKSKASKGKAKR